MFRGLTLVIAIALFIGKAFAQSSCDDLALLQKFLNQNKQAIEKLLLDKPLTNGELSTLEFFYQQKQQSNDQAIILENLDSEGLSLGQVTFTKREESAWWLLREETDPSQKSYQRRKLKSFLTQATWWEGNFHNTLDVVTQKNSLCLQSCQKKVSAQKSITDLYFQMTKVSNTLLSAELFRYQNHLELKDSPSVKSQELTPNTKTGPPKTEAFSEIERRQQKLNDLNNQATVKLFYQSHGPSPFVIIDKSKKRLFIYHQQILLYSQDIEGQSDDDAMSGGAGLYQLEKWQTEKLLLLDQRGRPLIVALKKNWVLCDETESCSQGQGETPSSIIQLIKAGVTPFTVIPNNDQLEFIVKNGELAFTTFTRGLPYSRYNFTPKNLTPLPIASVITIKEFDTKEARLFLKTLDREKENLMKMYRLDNDEYNQLTRLAFAIMGQESKFGTHWRYYLKENVPVGVAYIKRLKTILKDSYNDLQNENFVTALKEYIKERYELEKDLVTGGIDTSSNSRGPTQIKKVPVRIAQQYGVTKESLSNPEHAALATLAFLAEALEELKAKEKFHPDISGRNRIHYLHYIYMGKSYEIVKGTATPEKNIYYQNLQQYLKGIEIYQEIP